jgi:hypothetical protein
MKDPMPKLRKIFMGSRLDSSVVTVKTRGKLRVEINGSLIIFRLKKIIKGQIFLGIYPSSTSLPNADGLTPGDYALLQSGEVIQVL